MALNLTKGNPFKTLLLFSLPVIAGNLFQLFYTLADTIIVGQVLGADALAAVGATGTLVTFVLLFVQGATAGFGICLGHSFGRGRKKEMRESVATSLVLSVVIALVMTLPILLALGPILHLLNTPESIFQMAYDYMFVIVTGTFATTYYNLASNLLRALGDSRTPLIYLVFSSLLNIVLDIVFMVPLNMGVAGAAWATVLSQLLSSVLCTISGLRHFDVLHPTKEEFRLKKENIRTHLGLGLPMGLQMSVMCIGLFVMQGAINALGPSAIAGFTAGTKTEQLVILIDSALSVGLSNYVAQNYGAGLVHRIRQGIRASLAQVVIFNVVLGFLIYGLREAVVPVFISAPTDDIVRHASEYFVATVPFYLFLGVLIDLRTALQSMNNTTFPMGACVLELVGRISATLLLSASIGYTGICLASPAAWVLACLLVVTGYFVVIRRLERTICKDCSTL